MTLVFLTVGYTLTLAGVSALETQEHAAGYIVAGLLCFAGVLASSKGEV